MLRSTCSLLFLNSEYPYIQGVVEDEELDECIESVLQCLFQKQPPEIFYEIKKCS